MNFPTVNDLCLCVWINSDGQKIAIRLSKQVHKATSAIKKGVQFYNAVVGLKAGSYLPQTVTEKDALVPSSSMFSGILDIQQVA
jgi:hypothetical protein